MRVLHLVKTSFGAPWALRQMALLVKHGVEVHVAIPDGGPLIDQYRKNHITVHLLQTGFSMRKPWAWPALARSFRQLVAKVSPDVIHSHFVGTTLTMRLALGKRHPTPRLFQVPGPLHLEHPFFARGEIMTAGPCDRWVASCNWTLREYHRRGIDRGRVFLSYYGLDIEAFEAAVAPGKLRRLLGVDSSCRLVGIVAYMYAPKRYLGQTQGLKGHEDLIDAMAICSKKRDDLLLVIIGGASNGAAGYAKRVQEYAHRRLGSRVRLLGTRHDVKNLYPDFDLAVHPSHSENLGGAAESLLMGVPTITTNVGGFPDLVVPGETGWLVPPKTPNKLAEAILEALADPAEAKARALRGQEKTRALLDVRTIVPGLCRIYEEVLA